MRKDGLISSLDPEAFVGHIRLKRDERNEAGILAWRIWMQSKLDALLAVSDEEIAKQGALIPWMFPLARPSQSSPLAPVITSPAMRAAIKADPLLRLALVKAWRRMLQFYGLTIREGRVQWIGPRLGWVAKASMHDRKISRMLRCMHSAGISEQSQMLMTFLEAECASDPSRADALTWWRRQVAG